MSRWLYHFAVITDSLEAAVRERGSTSLTMSQGSIGATNDRRTAVMDIERALHNATEHVDDARMLAYYRVIMDGWNATHTLVSSWIGDNRHGASEAWEALSENGVLCESWDGHVLSALLPRPSNREILSIASEAGLGDYAADAFVRSLFDALRLSMATSGTFVLTARFVDAVVDDGAFRSAT